MSAGTKTTTPDKYKMYALSTSLQTANCLSGHSQIGTGIMLKREVKRPMGTNTNAKQQQKKILAIR